MALLVFIVVACVIYFSLSYRTLFLIPLVFLVAFFIHRLNYVPPYYMCCEIEGFDTVRQEFAKEADRQNLLRPTISNPDLGVMSWHKQFNIVDLGLLGSQIMARLKSGPMLAKYFFDYAAPDMIESHDFWSCHYSELIFFDPRFREMYVPVREKTVRWPRCGEKELPVGIWVRKDILKTSFSAERKLIDDLAIDLNVDRVKKELIDCQSGTGVTRSCIYVSRAVFRFLPEFRASGGFEHLVDIFELSRTVDFDLFLLTGFKDGRANEKAILSIYRDFLNRNGFLEVKGGNSFNIYVNDKYIIYLNESCVNSSILRPFYLHIIPAQPEAAKLGHSGFLNLDFEFRSFGFKGGNTCAAIRPDLNSGPS